MKEIDNRKLNERELTNTGIKDLLGFLEKGIFSCFVTLENQNMFDICAQYMMYRVQRDCYDLGVECGEFHDMSWEEFVSSFMCQNAAARTAAEIVIRETLKEFYRHGQYNFEAGDTSFISADGTDEILHFSELFSPEEGRRHIENLLFRIELALYIRQPFQIGDYSWTDFIIEIQKGPLWEQVWKTLWDTLVHLDFKPFWQSEELLGLLQQAMVQEV